MPARQAGAVGYSRSVEGVRIGARVVLETAQFAALLDALVADGHELVGPTVRDGAIVQGRIRGAADLPHGTGDEQRPGHYRLRERGDAAWFGYAASPHSYKRIFQPPHVPLLTIRRRDGAMTVEPPPPPPRRKIALIGARACELAAIRVQDVVLRDGPHADADYVARRRDVFVIAVHCGEPAGTCFCASMGTGPRAAGGYDVGAVEVLAPTHHFVVDIGSEAGAALVGRVQWREAAGPEILAADEVVEEAARRMGRQLDTRGLPELLVANSEHPRWAQVADRCLGCANCTMSCPTCFCTTTEDTTDLSGDEATRSRRWDSCFTGEFAHIHGGSARPSLMARYRQWMTHKLSTWHEQFGTSGCVGCGRCITWCPVGIDITEEVAAIRAAPLAAGGAANGPKG
jgi:ferredoxin